MAYAYWRFWSWFLCIFHILMYHWDHSLSGQFFGFWWYGIWRLRGMGRNVLYKLGQRKYIRKEFWRTLIFIIKRNYIFTYIDLKIYPPTSTDALRYVCVYIHIYTYIYIYMHAYIHIYKNAQNAFIQTQKKAWKDTSVLLAFILSNRFGVGGNFSHFPCILLK